MMALKFSLIVAVCFLCGLLVVIPPVFSINCYRKIVENDEVIVDDGVVHCNDPGDDKCGTLSFTVDSSITVEIRNCTKSARDCDTDVVCGRVREHVEALGGSLSVCSAICCDADNCNAPGAKKSTLMKVHGKSQEANDVNKMKEKLAKLITSHL